MEPESLLRRLPGLLDRRRHLDLEGFWLGRWVRRAGRVLLVAFLALGAANVFGQRPASVRDAAPSADLALRVPAAVRGGLVFQGTIDLEARRPLQQPALVLDEGWTDGLTINAITPEPTGQTVDEAGRLVLEYDPLAAGAALVVRLELQVNPTTVGRRSFGVALRDGERVLVRIDRPATVFP